MSWRKNRNFFPCMPKWQESVPFSEQSRGLDERSPYRDTSGMTTGPMRNRTAFTPLARAEFLEELAVLGTCRAAAAAAGVASSTIDYHLANDPEFAADAKDALDRHHRTLMQQVKKMALDGIVVAEIRNDHGQVVRQERKFSERLLLAYLQRMESGSWLNRIAVDAKHAGTVTHEHTGRIELEQLTPEQTRAARAFLRTLEPSPN